MTAAVVYLAGQPYRVVHDAGDELSATTYEPTSRPRSAAPILAVIGDSFSDPSTTSWALILGQQLGAEVVNMARGGAGYVRPASGWSFASAATAGLPADASVVVVWGGYNDVMGTSCTTLQLEYAARATVAGARRIAPDAALVIVGPQWPDASPDPRILDLRDAVARAAGAYGADVFADPIAERWFIDRPDVIGYDGLHPHWDANAQEYLAARIGAAVAAAVAARAG